MDKVSKTVIDLKKNHDALMRKKKMLLIINPVAGKGKANETLLKLVTYFSAFDYTVTVYPTKSKEKTIKYISANAYKYGVVVCCGGDGTFSQVVNALTTYDDPPKLGFVPLGSTNDIARTYGIPLDPLECAKMIVKSKAEKFDVGLFNLKPFAYVAAAGAFANVSYSTSRELKNRVGHLAYILSAIKEVPNIKPIRMRIEFDGKIIEDDFIYVSFSNTSSIGGVLNVNNVNTSDGLFELTLVKAPNGLLDTAEIIHRAVSSDFSAGMIRIFHTSSAVVRSKEELCWSLDGEEGGSCKKANFRIINKAINLIR
ncbi:MAG: YegS/Rv2252/BmrU family lipid kinase [Clostridia bacterium]|nr:YegS/Rv2252/BmrU family lipid kinase [Clostridia bacterium]